MMTKEELIIDEKYRQISEYNVEQLYLNLYSTQTNDDIKNKLLYIFAAFHCRLNENLAELNYRISYPTKHYKADDSRDLLFCIKSVFSLINTLRNTKYDFHIDKSYYFFLKEASNYLMESGGSTIPNDVKPLYLKSYEPIFKFLNLENEYLAVESNIAEIITLVSTRNANFEDMAEDEKLQNLNIAIEYMLKEKDKYMQFDYKNTFDDFISEQDVIRFRNVTQCFRHASKENIEKRKKFDTNKKKFLANYGLTICMAVLNAKKSEK